MATEDHAPQAPKDWRARLPASYPDYLSFRPVEGRGVGMFVLKDFAPGETVLEEKPMFTRPSPDEVAQRKWTPEWQAEFAEIQVPLCVPGEAPTEARLHAGPAMVRSILGFCAATPKVRREILKLWHPPLDSPHPLVEVARRLAHLCIKHLDECQPLPVTALQAGMLAIEMNLFTGGHVFKLFSRVNHSCFPNTVYIASKEGRRLRALRPIRAGDELSHCYLGEEQLLPTERRRWHLWRSKCFHCICERCTLPADPFRDMPCRACAAGHGIWVSKWRVLHKPGVWIRSEPSTSGGKAGFVEVDAIVESTGKMKGAWAEHTRGHWVLTDGTGLGLGKLCKPEAYEGKTSPQVPREYSAWGPYYQLFFRTQRPQSDFAGGPDDMSIVAKAVDDFALPEHCLEDPWLEIPYVRFEGDCWRCQTCGYEERDEGLILAERVMSRLAERTFFSPRILSATATYQFGRKATNLPIIDGAFLSGALDLATAITNVLGHWHWTTQWARILLTDVTSSVQSLSNHFSLREDPLRDLRVLWTWLESLPLAQNRCCWLYSRLERFQYVSEIEVWMRKLMQLWKESGQPQVNLLGLKNYVLEGVVSFG